MIAHARSTSPTRKHHPEATFQVLNMTEVSTLAGMFDAGFCIGNTAAHLDRASFEGFVAAMAETLIPGGTWILQVMNWDYVLDEGEMPQQEMPLPLIEGADGAVFRRTYRDISESSVTFATQLEVNGEVIFEDSVPLTPMRSAAIAAVHETHGFEGVTHAARYNGAPFDPQTFSANIFVFRREG